MEKLTKIIGNIFMDLVPEADNAFEAIDIYSASLYKRIRLKEQANIDYKDDLELYLFINGYKSRIAEIVHKQQLQHSSDKQKGALR